MTLREWKQQVIVQRQLECDLCWSCFTFNYLFTSNLPKDSFIGHNKDYDWNIETGYTKDMKYKTYPRRVLNSGHEEGLELTLGLFSEDFDFACGSFLQGFKVRIVCCENIMK